MNLNLENKTAFVCGSTQGIGKASALEMASLGATIVLIARNEDKLKATLAELPSPVGQKHSYIAADFTKPIELKAAIEKHIASGVSCHILVNNTGGPKGFALVVTNNSINGFSGGRGGNAGPAGSSGGGGGGGGATVLQLNGEIIAVAGGGDGDDWVVCVAKKIDYFIFHQIIIIIITNYILR